ncbi:MAG TPA: hypothetical protein VM844_03250 [Miltoncostaeaceae bacterium]|jgi:hypothetical protein|nr:hypothetical protein [Miltoncostaeaceae bacterium]
MREIDDDSSAHRQDEGGELTRLGPPGWAEFSAARERFMQTVTVAGLESAWGAPAQEPVRRGVGSP